ncbi:hypothetical protein K438DRAFT_1974994 [Mycena galopus ATCC 62051]|nr:hypothetical protein K438DRAFT_1974994 [Mycena galopus ATCC 62051]
MTNDGRAMNGATGTGLIHASAGPNNDTANALTLCRADYDADLRPGELRSLVVDTYTVSPTVPTRCRAKQACFYFSLLRALPLDQWHDVLFSVSYDAIPPTQGESGALSLCHRGLGTKSYATVIKAYATKVKARSHYYNMGLASKFTSEQDAYIATFLPELEELQKANSSAVGNCKKKKGDDIIASPLFFNQLPSKEQDPLRGATPAEWRKRITKKFENHLTQHGGSSKKATTAGAKNATGDDGLASGKSFFVRPALDGRRLFEVKNKGDILALAEATADPADPKGRFHHYQPSKKALWDGLLTKAQQEFETRAAKMKSDVGVNQKSFSDGISEDLDACVSSGLYGDMAVTILYAFRTPENSLLRGYASAHSSGNGSYFEDSGSDWSTAWDRWDAYAEKALPPRRPVYNLEHDIPADEDGTPVFPQLDVNKIAPANMASIVKEFILRLHKHCRPLEPFSWSTAATCYDSERFKLPVDMEFIECVEGVDAIVLAKFFMSLRDEARFVFLPPGVGNEEDENTDGGKGGGGGSDGEENEKSRNGKEDGKGGGEVGGEEEKGGDEGEGTEEKDEGGGDGGEGNDGDDVKKGKARGAKGRKKSSVKAKKAAVTKRTAVANRPQKRGRPPANKDTEKDEEPLAKKRRVAEEAEDVERRSTRPRRQPAKGPTVVATSGPSGPKAKPGYAYVLVDADNNIIATNEEATN